MAEEVYLSSAIFMDYSGLANRWLFTCSYYFLSASRFCMSASRFCIKY